jgi:cyclase
LIQAAAERFGAQCIVTAIDARKSTATDGWEVYIHGGRTPTGIDVVEWAKEAVRRGSGEILLTSMDGDGTQAGYDLGVTKAVSEAVDVPVIASGGAGNASHLADAVEIGRADAVLLASIIHDGIYTIRQLKQELHERGVPIRLSGW